ncbi:MAG: hypothetical protein ACR2GY_10700 [Phycisphaerales bacterium]
MDKGISHDRADDSLRAKARWYQSLPFERRMEIFCGLNNMIREINPELFEKKRREDARAIPGRVQIIERS